MITSKDVLKAVVKCKDDKNRVDYRNVMKELNIDDISLMPFLQELKQKRYIIQTLEDIEVTSLGLSACDD